MPSPIIDYVIVHELAHLRYLDHSDRFWGFVGSIVADYKERQRTLAVLGSTLAF